MPRYPAQQREQAVRAVAKGEAVTSAAKRLGIATDQTLYTWLKEAGLSPPYGEAYPKILPDGPLFSDEEIMSRSRHAPAPPVIPRKSYGAEFKRTAVRALALAVAEGEAAPLKAIAEHLEIDVGMLRGWAYKAGYMVHGGGLDWDKLRQDGMEGEGAAPAHSEDAPPRAAPPALNGSTGLAVLVLHTASGRQEITEDMLRRLWEDREHLLAENAELKRQREVFMSATTIYGNERPR
jgi:transposase-like protein